MSAYYDNYQQVQQYPTSYYPQQPMQSPSRHSYYDSSGSLTSQGYYDQWVPKPSPPQYVCLWPNCQASFSRTADLQRHMGIIHNRETLPLVDCNFAGCHRKGKEGFTRRDKMVDHMRDVHKMDIPKRQHSKDSRR